MLPNPRLQAWLDDEAAQYRSGERADQFARRAADTPLMRDLRAMLAASSGHPAEVRGVAEAFLARGPEVGDLVSAMSAEALADPFFRPPVAGVATEINTGFLLLDDPLIQLSAGIITLDALAAKKLAGAGAGTVTFTGYTTYFHVIEASGATLSLWEAPPIGDGFCAGADTRCRMVGRRVLKDGDTVTIDGRHQSFVLEHADGDIVHLQAVVKAVAGPLLAEYDSATGRFLSASSTDEAASRTQMMVTLLRLLDRTDALPLIRRSLDSPYFYTRWFVMRELLALDAEAALPDLRAMAEHDPHPEVRAAAAQTLHTFFDEEQLCPV